MKERPSSRWSHHRRAGTFGAVAVLTALMVSASCSSSRPASSVVDHGGVLTGRIWAPCPKQARSSISETIAVGSRMVSLVATGNCHDNAWNVTERLGSGPTAHLHISPVLRMRVVGFVALGPGWLPALLVRASTGPPYYTYVLVTDRDSRLAVVQPVGAPAYLGSPWLLMRVGVQGVNYVYGFSCAVSQVGYLRLSVYQVQNNLVVPPHNASVRTYSFAFTTRGHLRLERKATYRVSLAVVPNFMVGYC
jgi:hypothetical protein